MSSSDASSSSSSERESTPPHTKRNDKGKKKALPTSDQSGKNEGPDPNWKYKPPAGATLLQNVSDAGDFDWDAVASNDDLELWLIRVPDSIKPKYLESTTLERLSSEKGRVRAATLTRKQGTYDIWSIGKEEDDGTVGGDELKAISCLLPRKSKKGKLYPAPKPIARHLIVSAQPAVPTPDPSSTGPIQPYSRPPRQSYPKEVLKHAFKPYGSIGGVKETAEDAMDVDASEAQPAVPSSPMQKKKHTKADSPEVEKKSKGKKRKGEGVDVETAPQKKSKKAKTAS
ncbi:hypothetical protein H0H92_016001 [Tricholoma furcatifolium]|nr:hypothetical protein H0H92_016001 [Tricholoma furcatifolium]